METETATATEDEVVGEKQEKLKLAFYNGATVTLLELPEPKSRASPAIVNEAAAVRYLKPSILGMEINF